MENLGQGFCRDLRQCKTREEVEAFFDDIGISDLGKRAHWLDKAMFTERIFYCGHEPDDATKYEQSMETFLDPSWRIGMKEGE